MIVKVLFFASSVDATGLTDIIINFDDNEASSKPITTAHLIIKLEIMFPNLNIKRDQISLAVNEVYCREEKILFDGDTVALLPPISGG